MLVEEHTYIPLFGRWCEVCMFVDVHTYIHTCVWGLVSGMYVPLLGSLC